MPVPTYSLLEQHNDVVVYRIPDPTDRTHAFVEVGLFPWQLEGASSDAVLESWGTNEDPEEELFEGVGLRLDFTPPTRHHITPPDINDRITTTFDVFSRGGGSNGKTYRIQEATASELRTAAQSIAQYAHAYWWLLDQTDDFTPGVKRDESHTTRKSRLNLIESVTPDGTIVKHDGETIETPYSLDTCTFIEESQWDSPSEQCLEELNNCLAELLETYPEKAVWDAYHNADTDQILSDTTETDTVKNKRELKQALREVDGIGHRYRTRITNKFESLSALCDDLRNGGSELRSISGIGDTKEQALIDSLVESHHWKPHSNAN